MKEITLEYKNFVNNWSHLWTTNVFKSDENDKIINAAKISYGIYKKMYYQKNQQFGV